MRLAIALCLAAAVVIPDSAQKRPSDAVRPAGVVAALLAQGRMIFIDVASGRQLGEYVTPHQPPHTLTTGRLARATTGDEVFAVLNDGDVAIMGALNTRTFAAREVARLPLASYPALAVGSRTGALFAFRSLGAAVVVVDPRTSEQRMPLTVLSGREVYSGAVSADERRIYVSYHGNATGIDWFDLIGGEWRHGGYLPSHGGFALIDGSLLAASGDPDISEVDGTGRTLRTFNTALFGNHLMEFAVDSQRRVIYATGPCDYAGGFSATPWPPSGSAATRVMVAAGDYAVCGARISVEPNGRWVAIASRGDAVPRASRPGNVLIVDTQTGVVVQRLATSSDVVDVLAIR